MTDPMLIIRLCNALTETMQAPPFDKMSPPEIVYALEVLKNEYIVGFGRELENRGLAKFPKPPSGKIV